MTTGLVDFARQDPQPDEYMAGRSSQLAYVVAMPIIDVTHGPQVEGDRLLRLARMLPHAVSVAVECPEEPYDQPLQPGDIEIRFRPRGPYDISGLDIVVEVRSKWSASRADTRQARCDQPPRRDRRGDRDNQPRRVLVDAGRRLVAE